MACAVLAEPLGAVAEEGEGRGVMGVEYGGMNTQSGVAVGWIVTGGTKRMGGMGGGTVLGGAFKKDGVAGNDFRAEVLKVMERPL